MCSSVSAILRVLRAGVSRAPVGWSPQAHAVHLFPVLRSVPSCRLLDLGQCRRLTLQELASATSQAFLSPEKPADKHLVAHRWSGL